MRENDLTFTAKNVEEFMAYYRGEFPSATVTPKLHILKDHMLPWLQTEVESGVWASG